MTAPLERRSTEGPHEEPSSELIEAPTEADFTSNLAEVRKWASSVGYAEDDVGSIVKEVRQRKRA